MYLKINHLNKKILITLNNDIDATICDNLIYTNVSCNQYDTLQTLD